MIEEIENFSARMVLQFLTKNALVNVLAGKIVREMYPHVIWGGCVVHNLNSICENFGQFD